MQQQRVLLGLGVLEVLALVLSEPLGLRVDTKLLVERDVHRVSGVLAQRVGLAGSIDPHHAPKATCSPRRHARQRILEHRRLIWLHAQRPRAWHRSLTLIFSARAEADVIDRDRFAAWQAQHPQCRFMRTLIRGDGPPRTAGSPLCCPQSIETSTVTMCSSRAHPSAAGHTSACRVRKGTQGGSRDGKLRRLHDRPRRSDRTGLVDLSSRRSDFLE
jgi:hypothetical protein